MSDFIKELKEKVQNNLNIYNKKVDELKTKDRVIKTNTLLLKIKIII